MIYFIKSESGHVKIGYSYNGVSKRLSALQSTSPIKLSLVEVFDGGVQREAMLHEKFKEDRLHGEWFKFSDEIKSFIKNPAWPDKIEIINQTVNQVVIPLIKTGSPRGAAPKQTKPRRPIKQDINVLYQRLGLANKPDINKLKKVLLTLKVREKDIIVMRYAIGCEQKTLEHIGDIFGVTRERIRQIEAKALRKLRHPTRSNFLREDEDYRSIDRGLVAT